MAGIVLDPLGSRLVYSDSAAWRPTYTIARLVRAVPIVLYHAQALQRIASTIGRELRYLFAFACVAEHRRTNW